MINVKKALIAIGLLLLALVAGLVLFGYGGQKIADSQCKNPYWENVVIPIPTEPNNSVIITSHFIGPDISECQTGGTAGLYGISVGPPVAISQSGTTEYIVAPFTVTHSRCADKDLYCNQKEFYAYAGLFAKKEGAPMVYQTSLLIDAKDFYVVSNNKNIDGSVTLTYFDNGIQNSYSGIVIKQSGNKLIRVSQGTQTIPDLTISTINTGTITLNKDASIPVVIKNSGAPLQNDVNKTHISVDLSSPSGEYLNSPFSEDVKIVPSTVAAPGGNEEKLTLWPIPAPGTYQMEITVNSDKNTIESNWDNDTYTTTLIVPPGIQSQ